MRILVVEDERVAAEVLAKGLREHAYAVDVAWDGATALEQAGTNDYDLIVLDVLRPWRRRHADSILPARHPVHRDIARPGARRHPFI